MACCETARVLLRRAKSQIDDAERLLDRIPQRKKNLAQIAQHGSTAEAREVALRELVEKALKKTVNRFAHDRGRFSCAHFQALAEAVGFFEAKPQTDEELRLRITVETAQNGPALPALVALRSLVRLYFERAYRKQPEEYGRFINPFRQALAEAVKLFG